MKTEGKVTYSYSTILMTLSPTLATIQKNVSDGIEKKKHERKLGQIKHRKEKTKEIHFIVSSIGDKNYTTFQ